MNVIDWNGRKISEPGIYRGIPIDAYHGDICEGPSISSSGLRKIFNESPAHYYVDSPYRVRAKDEPPPEPPKMKEGFILGRAAHHLFLEQKGFASAFVVRPDTAPDGRDWHHANKTCKAWVEAHEAAKRTILTANQWTKIQGMAKSLAREPLIRSGILHGKIEHSIIVRDPETGVWIKVRPDVIPTASLDFVDLKTTAAIDDDDLELSIGNFAYHMQGALIGIVAPMVFGAPMESFNLVFIESDQPHCVRAVEVKQEAIKEGMEQCRAALRLFARCIKTGDWIGPAGHQTEMAHIGLKPWRAERNKYRLAQIERELKAEPIPADKPKKGKK